MKDFNFKLEILRKRLEIEEREDGVYINLTKDLKIELTHLEGLLKELMAVQQMGLPNTACVWLASNLITHYQIHEAYQEFQDAIGNENPFGYWIILTSKINQERIMWLSYIKGFIVYILYCGNIAAVHSELSP